VPLASGQVFEALSAQVVPGDVDARQTGPLELHQSFNPFLPYLLVPYIRQDLLISISSSSWVTHCEMRSNISGLNFSAFF
jgi:hypothetical protein